MSSAPPTSPTLSHSTRPLHSSLPMSTSCPAVRLASLCSVRTRQAAPYPRAFKFVVPSARNILYSFILHIVTEYLLCAYGLGNIVINRVDKNPSSSFHSGSFPRLFSRPNLSCSLVLDHVTSERHSLSTHL